MSADLYDYPTEREVLTVLGAASELDVGRARLLLEQMGATREDFHLPAHAELFELAAQFIRSGRPVDLVGITAATKGNKLITPKLVGELFGAIPGPEHALQGHAQTLRALSVKRKALGILREAQALLSSHSTDVEAVIGDVSSRFAGLSMGRRTDVTGEELAHRLSKEVHDLADGTATRCILTGVDVWDQVFGGLECGTLTFIGAQPSVGKNKLFTTFIENLSATGNRPGVVSLEDDATWAVRRPAAREAKIPNFVLAKKRLGETQLARFDEALSSLANQGALNYRATEERLLTPAQIVAQVRDWVVNKGVKAVFLDHLGEVDWEAQKYGRHDLAITHGLSLFSKVAHEYRIPFVIAAHMAKPEHLGKNEDARYVRPRLTDFALAQAVIRKARNAAGLYLSREHPDCVMVANLKQTNGNSDDDFPVKEVKGAAMLASENGLLAGDRYESEEQAMLDLGGGKS